MLLSQFVHVCVYACYVYVNKDQSINCLSRGEVVF